MPDAPAPGAAPEAPNVLAVRGSRKLSGPAPRGRSVRSGAAPAAKRWQPPEGLAPDDVHAVVAAAATERDRLLLRVLWATGARISEALALRPADVHPHLLRHARVRRIVRTTKSLPVAQKQAGWSRLQLAYLSVGDDEVREAMRGVPD